jgi:predicted RNA-binding Zn-ribbon protein involved in translation (DUF1610 family)
MTGKIGDRPPVPTTAAVCGLLCDACSIFIGSQEDPERLAAFAARQGWSVEEARCDGCRADRRTSYCRDCDLFACAASRGYAFCGECEEYPCAALDEFRCERPHRTEIYENLDRISKAGVDVWMQETKERFTCSSCGTLNSAYDLKCRKCGQEPGSAYVAAHRETIVERLRQL